MRQHLGFMSLTLLLCAAPLTAESACAPPPSLMDETKKVDTEGAIGQFMKLTGLNVRASVASEKKAVFTAFPNADQMVVVLTMIYNFCSALDESKDMTGAQKIAALMEFQTALLLRAVGPQPVASTAPARRDTPSMPQDQLGGEKKSDWHPEAPRIQLIAVSTPSGAPFETKKPSWADIYLNPVPIVITEKNKYFVIVGSASSQAEGTRRMTALKSKYPNHDFELYGPYGSNPSFGIMIASWVSKERAEEALRAAKAMEKTSFLWACRNTGDQC
ncbi:MAG: hypothetical protein QOF14_2187 [Hyphomicrobiales bacterium]|jgi:hypothetical protein|nr:hypothetical protein [Hyphomicrobiales bacterium]